MKNRDGRKTVRSCMNMKEYVIEKTVGAPDWTKAVSYTHLTLPTKA